MEIIKVREEIKLKERVDEFSWKGGDVDGEVKLPEKTQKKLEELKKYLDEVDRR